MKLYGVPGSPSCTAVLICARELGLSLDMINLGLQDARNPEYLALNPMGKVPTLADGDATLWESSAILVYLAGQKPDAGLLPTAGMAQADTLRWLFFFTAHLQPALMVLGYERRMKALFTGSTEVDQHRVEWAEQQLARFLPVLEAQLAHRDFLTGRLSIADIPAAVTIRVIQQMAGLNLEPFPAVSAWVERLYQREAWRPFA